MAYFAIVMAIAAIISAVLVTDAVFRPESTKRERRYAVILSHLSSHPGATADEIAVEVGRSEIDVSCDLGVLELTGRVRCDYVPQDWGRVPRSEYRAR